MSRAKSKGNEGAVTLTQVAEQAGVSVMTASRALSGEGYVSDKTRERVLAAAGELGYSPNLSARVMRGGRTNVIGVLVTALNTSVVNMITTEITGLVRKAGMDLLIYNAADSAGAANSNGIGMLKSMCDGLLLVMPRLTEAYTAALEKSQSPVVLINYWRSDTHLPVVRADNYFSSRDAVRHLLDLGHRRIGFITGSAFSGQSPERQRGYTDALAEHGIAIDDKLIVPGTFSHQSGVEGALRLLKLPNRPTAIFAANDDTALGVLDAARSLNLSIPEDLSVIGFDDITAAANTHPALTTIRQPLASLAESAVQELLTRLGKTGQQHSAIELPSELVIRASTAAPPAKAPRAKRSASKS
jgi:LacI family transcriptional regulator